MRVHRGRTGARRSLSEADYAAAITACHQQLRAPIMLCWDILNTHISAEMHTFIAAHADWLTAVRFPAYAPELNPVEGVWASLKNGLGNLAVLGVDQLAAIVKNRLKRMQYRPDLIDGFLAQTGLWLEAEPRDRPWPFKVCSDHVPCRGIKVTDRVKLRRCSRIGRPVRPIEAVDATRWEAGRAGRDRAVVVTVS